MSSKVERIRLGIAGDVDSFHGRCMASIVNGVKDSSVRGRGVFDRIPGLAGLEVAAVFDPNQKTAETFVDEFGVANIANSVEELADMVDGVCILCDQDVMDHYKLGIDCLEHGIPTYIDKPFAATVAEAQSVVDVAVKCDVPVLSCSARRFDPLIVGGAALAKKELKTVRGAHLFGDWRYKNMIWYGVHAIDVLFAVLGSDIVAVHEVGNVTNRLMKLTYRNGLVVVVDLPYDIGTGTTITMFGDCNTHYPFVTVSTGRTPFFFEQLLYRIGGMIQSGISPVPYNEMTHVIRVLNAAEQSLQENREIKVDMNAN